MKESDFDLMTAYLLDELSAEDRRMFEQRLKEDAALRDAHRETEAAMVGFARLSSTDETATVEMWERIQEATMERPQIIDGQGVARRMVRFLWPMAAALLIGFNLFQYQEQQHLNNRWEALETAYERKQALILERDNALDSLWTERNELKQQLSRVTGNGLASSSKFQSRLP